MSEQKREVVTREHIRNMVDNYDGLIRKLIPHYDEMQQCVIGRLRFPPDSQITVLDLGIGTGDVTKRIFETFPNCRVIGVDLSSDMIEGAKQKLVDYGDRIEWILGDMDKVHLPEEIDAVASTLAIHHLTNGQKRDFYARIFQCLKPGGVLSVGDIVTFQNPEKAAKTEAEWKNFIYGTLGPEQGQYRFDEYKKGDIPAPLENQLEWLKDAGLEDVSVDWKLMNYAVFGGRKP